MILVEKGFEQQGFECHKFVRLLDERGIYSIGCLGAIMASVGTSREYRPMMRSLIVGHSGEPIFRQLD